MQRMQRGRAGRLKSLQSRGLVAKRVVRTIRLGIACDYSMNLADFFAVPDGIATWPARFDS
jgi:hypothetical protein